MKKALNFLKKHKVFSLITLGIITASIVLITKKSKNNGGNYIIAVDENLLEDEKLIKALTESAKEYLRLNPGEDLYVSLQSKN